MASIVELLKNINAQNNNYTEPFFVHDKVSYTNEIVKKIEEDFETALPQDYQNVLLNFGSGNLTGIKTQLIFLNKDELYDIPQYPLDESLDPAFVFGTDNGGNYYYYDINNLSGEGHFTIFIVYPGNPQLRYSKYLGRNLTEVVEKIINGEGFSNYPLFGKR